MIFPNSSCTWIILSDLLYYIGLYLYALFLLEKCDGMRVWTGWFRDYEWGSLQKRRELGGV